MEGAKTGFSLPFKFTMSELTADAVLATAVFPEPVATLLPEMLFHGELDQLVSPVGKAAFLVVVTIAQLGKGFAQLGLVLQRVGLLDIHLLLTVPLRGRPRCQVARALFASNAHGISKFKYTLHLTRCQFECQ